MPEQSEHHQQDDVDGQQRIIEKGEQDESKCSIIRTSTPGDSSEIINT